MAEDAPADFRSSEIGTQHHWDDAYQKEIENFTELGDVGEIWYGEDTQNRMVRWICKKSNFPTAASIIDLGCGNGTLLLALRKEGYSNLTGVDYSEYSVKLAEKVSASEDVTDIAFEVCDILSPAEASKRHDIYDICLDKGTYDAICLKNTEDPTDRKTYVSHVFSMLRPKGILILTSGNWTKEELNKHFCKAFDLTDEIPAPTFTFGGKTGQTVTTLIFTRKDLIC